MSGLQSVEVVKREDWAPGLMTLTIAPQADFTAGQFFNLGVQQGDELVRRSYSAASAPGGQIEFFLSEVKGGQLTPSLFALRPGDQLLLDEQALGFFTLLEVPECKHLWLVATGTGLGPYISMMRSGELMKRFERVSVVHGVRHENQLAYRQELEKFAAEHSGFDYLPVLSAEIADELFPETETAVVPLRGRITHAWDVGALEKTAAPFTADSHMLLCGNPQMIEDMCARLKERGFEKHRRRKPGHFNFERYW